MLSYVTFDTIFSIGFSFGWVPWIMKLKKSTMAIVGLLVLGAIAIAAVAMGDGKTARKAVRIVGGDGHGRAPDPSIVAAEDAKKNPAQPGLAAGTSTADMI